MLRKRSRAVTSKQAIVTDHNNHLWLQPEKPTKSTSFFLNSPKFLKGFFSNAPSSSSPSSLPETEQIMSPTSILDTKPFSSLSPSFWAIDTKSPKSNNKHSWETPNSKKGIGLALIDENPSTKHQQSLQKRKLVVFGSQLRIQVPPSSVFPCFSPVSSPVEFGIKTPKNNLCQVHPEKSSENEGALLNESISMSDMEQSEDYTCVISHGPNPKTTHIFGNCIVESCCGVVGGSSSFGSRRNGHLSPSGNSVASPSGGDFLSFCHHCKKRLGQGSDIYMYRGEKAFCSQECRCQEMLFDGVDN